MVFAADTEVTSVKSRAHAPVAALLAPTAMPTSMSAMPSEVSVSVRSPEFLTTKLRLVAPPRARLLLNVSVTAVAVGDAGELSQAAASPIDIASSPVRHKRVHVLVWSVTASLPYQIDR